MITRDQVVRNSKSTLLFDMAATRAWYKQEMAIIEVPWEEGQGLDE